MVPRLLQLPLDPPQRRLSRQGLRPRRRPFAPRLLQLAGEAVDILVRNRVARPRWPERDTERRRLRAVVPLLRAQATLTAVRACVRAHADPPYLTIRVQIHHAAPMIAAHINAAIAHPSRRPAAGPIGASYSSGSTGSNVGGGITAER